MHSLECFLKYHCSLLLNILWWDCITHLLCTISDPLVSSYTWVICHLATSFAGIIFALCKCLLTVPHMFSLCPLPLPLAPGCPCWCWGVKTPLIKPRCSRPRSLLCGCLCVQQFCMVTGCMAFMASLWRCVLLTCVLREFKSLWSLRQWVVCMCVCLCVCSEYQCALCVVYSLNAAGHLQIVCMCVWLCVVSISTCSEDVCHCGNV